MPHLRGVLCGGLDQTLYNACIDLAQGNTQVRRFCFVARLVQSYVAGRSAMND